MNVLAQHIDSPQQRHRLVLLDATRLRCFDCDRTLVLPARPSAPSSTSGSSLDHPRNDEDRCALHVHEWVHNCRACAADAKAATAPPARPQPNAPTGPEWEAARARFGRRTA